MTDFFGLFSVDTAYIVIGLLVVVIVLAVLLILNLKKTKKLQNNLSVFMSGKDVKTMEDEIKERFADIENLKDITTKHSGEIQKIDNELLSVYKKVGIVKYDAFNEMGGKLSFALAMLDKSNNGYIINAMHSREGCYTYIKEIVKGESFIALGEEEQQALDMAIKSDAVMI